LRVDAELHVSEQVAKALAINQVNAWVVLGLLFGSAAECPGCDHNSFVTRHPCCATKLPDFLARYCSAIALALEQYLEGQKVHAEHTVAVDAAVM
jgi:hypothetical protein